MNIAAIKQTVRQFDFPALFVEQLGWDNARQTMPVNVDGQNYTLQAVAEKRGMTAWICNAVPESKLRRKIEHKVTERSREHLIVFTDGTQTQIWQWVRREQGKPTAPREHQWHRGQDGESLAQKLQRIAFTLEEEDTLTLSIVGERTAKAFNVETVTKRFYDKFKDIHKAFLGRIEGIDDTDDREWYASVLLNRLMFVYFLQNKGFLDNDTRYLRNRYNRVREQSGEEQFYNFYRKFLIRLFHDGLGKKYPAIPAELLALIGDVPYLNGGIFQMHKLEDDYNDIQIPDEAFRVVFDFFDSWDWTLDDRPTRNDREINPDVLGFIFEKYINQKEMGAYYTKEDITEYIGRNTIVPFLMDEARKQCSSAFEGEGAVWTLLQNDPDRYIFPALAHGANLPLPDTIAAGVAEVDKRGDWNKPAPAEFALPTEIWRETVARRERYADVRGKLERGEVRDINTMITLNLDIRRFAEDVIAGCEDVSLLKALWRATEKVKILDPTVGSGAFLFAALNILYPLYELCLSRMGALAGDAERSGNPNRIALVREFADIVARVRTHKSERYDLLKRIIVNNLYGVDIMHEATEICKLRLFLKLVVQIDSRSDLEPLPDIDFNIRAGNTLVGYATLEDISRQWQNAARLDLYERDPKLEMLIREYDLLLRDFRATQLGENTGKPVSKADVERAANQELRPKLDADLWNLYKTAGKINDKMTKKGFAITHEPFHWCIEFPDVMAEGFDVIIGNPPYVGYSPRNAQYQIVGYETAASKNLYAYSIERAFKLLNSGGYFGMIVPIASVSTETMRPLQELYFDLRQWHSHYAVRPGKLFVGVDMNLTITLLRKEQANSIQVTEYHRWSGGEPSSRPHLFSTIAYQNFMPLQSHSNPLPKHGDLLADSTLRKMHQHGKKLRHYVRAQGTTLYYHSGGRYWRKALSQKLSSHYKPITVGNDISSVTFCLLNSQLFYWYWIANSNCMDVVSREVLELPVFALEEAENETFRDLQNRLTTSYYEVVRTRNRQGEIIAGEEFNFNVGVSKPIIDEIDRVLANHYGFTPEELDFVLNYDIKYRMGRGGDDD